MRRVTTWEYQTLRADAAEREMEDGEEVSVLAPELLQRLGAQGWEAYAATRDAWFLRRPTGTLVVAD